MSCLGSYSARVMVEMWWVVLVLPIRMLIVLLSSFICSVSAAVLSPFLAVRVLKKLGSGATAFILPASSAVRQVSRSIASSMCR